MADARHWDFVFSCFEPVAAVSGGIGTYVRLLLELLGASRNGGAPRVLFFTSVRNQTVGAPSQWDGVVTEYLPEQVILDGVSLNNLNDPYRHFAFGLMMRLRELEAAGHTFGFLEIPDWAAEGYFAVKARRHGLLRIGAVGVRLHSPGLMLFEDNREVGEATPARRRVADEEQYVYRHADRVLYGGDAMLARIAALIPEVERAAFLAKAVKIPHPWPAIPTGTAAPVESSAMQIGYVGRLEYRKGVDLLVRAAVKLLERERTPAVFHFFGRDTMTHRAAVDTYPATYQAASMLQWLQSMVPEQLRPAFVFHGYTSQADLWQRHLPAMDAFVFPSRFENYPNVLLEVLSLGRPVLVSQHGCMPEIGHGFPSVQAFDPFDEPAFAAELATLVRQGRRTFDVRAQYREKQAAVADEIARAYAGLRTLVGAARPASVARPAPRIAFVVPHFNQSRWLPALWSSVRPQIREGDELIVVDDASAPEEARAARAFAEAEGIRFVALATNRGPSAARNAGAGQATQELLYFIDADDEVVPDSVDVLRQAMRDDPGLDVVSGFMRAFGDENHCWASYDPSVGTILREHTSHCGVVVRREVFARVGGYEERVRFRHWEDWEFHLRLVLHGARFEVVPCLTYRYRVDKGRGRNSIDLDRIVESHEALLRAALASVPPERLAAIWPEISALLIDGLLKQAASVPVVVYPDLIRYKVVDSLNDFMRRTPLHAPLKRVFGWRWRLQQPPS